MSELTNVETAIRNRDQRIKTLEAELEAVKVKCDSYAEMLCELEFCDSNSVGSKGWCPICSLRRFEHRDNCRLSKIVAEIKAGKVEQKENK